MLPELISAPSSDFPSKTLSAKQAVTQDFDPSWGGSRLFPGGSSRSFPFLLSSLLPEGVAYVYILSELWRHLGDIQLYSELEGIGTDRGICP